MPVTQSGLTATDGPQGSWSLFCRRSRLGRSREARGWDGRKRQSRPAPAPPGCPAQRSAGHATLGWPFDKQGGCARRHRPVDIVMAIEVGTRQRREEVTWLRPSGNRRSGHRTMASGIAEDSEHRQPGDGRSPSATVAVRTMAGRSSWPLGPAPGTVGGPGRQDRHVPTFEHGRVGHDLAAETGLEPVEAVPVVAPGALRPLSGLPPVPDPVSGMPQRS